jgi:hypothetical protein
MGYAMGGVVYWNVGWPRLEFNAFVDSRKQGDRDAIPYVGLPVLVKFSPAENSLLSWEVGAGVQTDLALSGAGTRRNVLVGVPLATDLLINLGVYLNFEIRYVLGLTTYDGGTTGGRPRDLDVLFGLMFPIDRD